ncbi:MAG TPA: amylo-alpha-1,6-glucosidase [Ktedonobacteraceae bacterium]|nr:amylo-alpha-1,6-glucosidase [Ktedonobacteraceae bacterium]
MSIDYQETAAGSPSNAWNLFVSHDICGDVQAALDREWFVTNGLGGYAGSSIAGATTRSYHGLLVAALHPPVERTVLVTKIDEEVALPDGHVLKLGVNEYQDGTIDPQGYNYLERFALEGDVACFSYTLENNLHLEKRIWMEYGQNTTYVQYMVHDLSENELNEVTLNLRLFPFCLYRDHHSTTQGSLDWHFQVEVKGNSCCMRAYAGAQPYWLIAGPVAKFVPTDYWYWHLLHRRDRERGLPYLDDVYQPGVFHTQIAPGKRVTLVLSAEEGAASEFGGSYHEDAVVEAHRRHSRRIRQLLDIADRSTRSLAQQDPVRARLVIAADQFIVARPEKRNEHSKETESFRLSPDRKTIIAGYPWFTDWGRDSMISLSGLLLCTGRFSEARGLIKAFASYAQQGLIPNRFPDSGEAPEYNTADATLWMFHAIHSYIAMTGDWSLVKDLYPTLSDIIDWHVRGTLYNIGIDPSDGLLHAGAPGVQLTWMDAKVNDWVVTPRHGKPVEINALWYCALGYMESWAIHLSKDALEYGQLRSRVGENFALRFWYEDGGYLYDVVDVDGIAGKNDSSLRPNQLFAASLTRNLLSEEQIRSMFAKVTQYLLTPMGLRTLSPEDPAYRNHFNGNPEERDGAYHQGTVWPWLIGPYSDVYLRLHNDSAAIIHLLKPLLNHLWDFCLGTICEVAEPEPPFAPAGCYAQAWSVAELLRAWLMAAG